MLDEVALPEEHLGRDTLWQRGAQFLQRGLDLLSELQRVKAGRLINAEDHAHRAVHAGIAAHGRHGVAHLRHIADEHRAAAHGLDHGLGQVIKARGHAEIAYHDLLRPGLQIAAGGIPRRTAHGLLHLRQGDAKRSQPVRIRLHLDLLHSAADGEHLGDTADALQTPPQRPVCQRAQVHRRDVAWLARLDRAAQPHEQDLAHERRNRRHAGFHPLGQGGKHPLQALLHELAGAIDVRAPSKLRKDERQTHIRAGAQAVEPADALHRCLEPLGDERLHLLRREAGSLGEDRHRRLRHVRQNLHWELGERLIPKSHRHQRQHQNQRTVMQ